jgi:REP element-mobilizing transposase RayT
MLTPQPNPAPQRNPIRAATARERSRRYLITFTCYGNRLHGDESGSVDRNHNQYNTCLLDPDPHRLSSERQTMPQPPYLLDQESRDAVLRAIQQHCLYRGWNLLAAHIRTNHVHTIVEANVRPEVIMTELKLYASRELNRLSPDQSKRKRWSRHGSTRWLWKDDDVQAALQYVVEQQGKPMALFVREDL